MSTTLSDSFNTSGSDLLGFNCASCLTSYLHEFDYKMHYKTEFHKYNVLRRMVNLPVVSKEQFEKHVEESKKLKSRGEVDEKQDYYCKTCQKKFTNNNTLKQHLSTKKHIQAEKQREVDAERDELMINEMKDTLNFKKESQAPRSSPLEDNKACLFCSLQSTSFEVNLEHMEKKHGFFISEEQFCVNKKGLFTHIAKKILEKKLCIYCENVRCGNFKSGVAVQNHMVDKGHCFMHQDYFDEYERFYDFTEDNERIAKQMEEKYKNSKFGVEIDYEISNNTPNKITDVEEIIDDDEEGDWEDMNSQDGSAVESESEITENKEGKAKKILKGKQLQRRMFKLRRAKLLDNDELMLPSGRIAGHKQYERYYKQRIFIRDDIAHRYLENGRSVYTGKKTYDQALMLKEDTRPDSKGQVKMADYNRFLMRQRMKHDKHLTKTAYMKEKDMYMKLGMAGSTVLTKFFRLQYRE